MGAGDWLGPDPVQGPPPAGHRAARFFDRVAAACAGLPDGAVRGRRKDGGDPAARHSNAGVITVQIKADKNCVCCSIKDDGKGFEPAAVGSPASFGLQNTESRVTAYILQRSADNNTWKDIYTVASAKFSKKKLEKFFDQYPQPTKNYYRLKMSMEGSVVEYSPTIVVIIGNTANSWVMYPVPVRDVLNLQYNGSDAISGVISIFIQNMHGYILLRNRFSSLNRSIQLPVGNLGRGIYDIRIAINDEIVWNQRFVK